MEKKSNIKITIFIGNLAIGGAERVAINLSKGFSDLGYDVDMVLLNRQGKMVEDIPNRVNTVDLGVERARWSLQSLVRYIHSTKPDTIISIMTQANILSIIANKIAGDPAVTLVTEHTTLSKKNSLTAKRDRILAQITYKYADHIVGVSKGTTKDVCKWANLPQTEVKTIYNPVFEKEFIGKDYDQPAHPWFRNENVSTIMSAGRHVEQKDYTTLIKSFAKLPPEHNARLVLLGEGELTEKYKDLADQLGVSEHIWMPGFIKDPFDYMYHSDLFVLSSKIEGLSLVLIEALGTGTPVVSTDCPYGPSEVLDGGTYGTLVPVGDEIALANAISNSLKNSENYARLHERATEFTIERAVQKYEELLKECL
ncbi:glycosyl transferase [Halobiforma lacisalsi AJ5]|uniref:Glycosyl transferase n=1 Tax=Natronobacterium lacisalsi AJ5 TaxID=358396 RepID=M0L107_NATLA|nr:glycosyltransferase [Halobiforma lacisalsi]APW98882.1 glycosyl transferase [Halobiforma lacisalsi AJ5]EMA27231.1 group 1 glycosyl transferase [Halobiforma lacisalsi AJ5]